MEWILLEALGALVLLMFLVWWTMFSGRPKGERADHASSRATEKPQEPTKN